MAKLNQTEMLDLILSEFHPQGAL